MPVDKYFKGHGSEVMSSMRKKYGAKKGTSVFYRTANKHGMNPAGESMMKHKMAGKFKKRSL